MFSIDRIIVDRVGYHSELMKKCRLDFASEYKARS